VWIFSFLVWPNIVSCYYLCSFEYLAQFSSNLFTLLYCFIRWRSSFLFGLAFGCPAMAVMMYYMWRMSTSVSCHHGNMTIDSANMSVIMELANASIQCVPGHHMMATMCQPEMTMILPGLSLKNFLLFIFCTPCQVHVKKFAFSHFYQISIHSHCSFLLLLNNYPVSLNC
jgi:hypothetical protein